MYLFGVVNCSPDSLHEPSIVRNAAEAAARIEWLQAAGAEGLDVGGQGSTFVSTVVDAEAEWARLRDVLPWRWRPPTCERRHLPARGHAPGDGARRQRAQRRRRHGRRRGVGDRRRVRDAWWWCRSSTAQPARARPRGGRPARRHGESTPLRLLRGAAAPGRPLRPAHRCLLDPGTGFGPHGWEWADRYLYQKQVYTNLDRLRVFDLPLYIPLPWKDTAQHAELLDIVLAKRPEYGRAHEPDRIRAAEGRLRR